jgi:hypothetical protein
VRSDGASGLIFLNNRNINVNMSDQVGVRVTLVPPPTAAAAAGSAPAAAAPPIIIPPPSSPAPTLPAGAWAAWPFNLPLPSAITLAYATATPLTTLPGGTPPYYPTAVFVQTPGTAPAELAFANATTASTLPSSTAAGSSTGGSRPLRFSQCAVGATCGEEAEGGLLVARGLPQAAGLGPLCTLSYADAEGGIALQVVVLNTTMAARAWGPVVLAGTPTLLLSDAATSFLLLGGGGGGGGVGGALEVHTEGVGAGVEVWALPPPATLSLSGGGGGGSPLTPSQEGLFSRYAFPAPPASLVASATLLAPAAPARVIPVGPKGNAWAPSADGTLGEFEGAEVWGVSLAGEVEEGGAMDVRLRVAYSGDCARVYEGGGVDRGSIAMDHFFNGHPLELPLTRSGYNASSTFTLRVLPLAKNAPEGSPFPWGPVMFEVPPVFNSSGIALGLSGVEAVHTWRAVLVATPAAGGV